MSPSDPRTARSKPAQWKSFSPTGHYFAAAPNGEFLVVGEAPVQIDGVFKTSLSVHRKGGESITVPLPGNLGGLAVLPDGRIAATIAKTYIPNSSTRDYAEAGLVLMNSSGSLLGRLSGTTFAGAGAIAVDPTGKRIAFRAMPRETDHPRYLKSQLFALSLDALLNQGEITHALDFAAVSPLMSFGDDGSLFAVGTGRSICIEPDDEIQELTPHHGAFTAEPSRFNQLGLSVAGTHQATVGHLDEIVVREDDRILFQLPANVCTRGVLVEGGKTLLTVAEAAKKRLGRAGEASVQWPSHEPLLREDNVAIWDVATGSLRRALPRASGAVFAIAPVEGQFVVLYAMGTKSRVDFIEWEKLFGK